MKKYLVLSIIFLAFFQKIKAQTTDEPCYHEITTSYMVHAKTNTGFGGDDKKNLKVEFTNDFGFDVYVAIYIADLNDDLPEKANFYRVKPNQKKSIYVAESNGRYRAFMAPGNISCNPPIFKK
uniref:hypothetical protein n=1 Tax=Flavobacterium sp. TaxID=239 RepID=UPI00404AF894